MTMFTSLKALLFPAAPAVAGAIAPPAVDAADFAGLMSGTMAASPSTSRDAGTGTTIAVLPAIGEATGDHPVSTEDFLKDIPRRSPALFRAVMDMAPSAVPAPIAPAPPAAAGPVTGAPVEAPKIPASEKPLEKAKRAIPSAPERAVDISASLRQAQSGPGSAASISPGPQEASAPPAQTGPQAEAKAAAPIPASIPLPVMVETPSPVEPAEAPISSAPVESMPVRRAARVTPNIIAADKKPRAIVERASTPHPGTPAREPDAVETSGEADVDRTEYDPPPLAAPDASRQPTPLFAPLPVMASASPAPMEARSEAPAGGTAPMAAISPAPGGEASAPSLLSPVTSAPAKDETRSAHIVPKESPRLPAVEGTSPPSPIAPPIMASPVPASPPPEPADRTSVETAGETAIPVMAPAMPLSADAPATTVATPPLSPYPDRVAPRVAPLDGPLPNDMEISVPVAASAPAAMIPVPADEAPAFSASVPAAPARSDLAPVAPTRADTQRTESPQSGTIGPVVQSRDPVHLAAAAPATLPVPELPKDGPGRPMAQPVAAARVDSAQVPAPPVAVDAAVPAAVTEAIAKTVKFEALSLLTLVRDQFRARLGGEKDDRGKIAAKPAVTPAGTAQIVAPDGPLAAPPVQATPVVSAVMAPLQSPPPAVDLSASIGAQLVEMGVSGQWIDGLARDIAGLAANGAQGRFQIDTNQLGSVQVDIRHSIDGAAVSLTVATQAAEQALRQDRDRLQIDAGPSAVRITELKIERASPVESVAFADTPRRQADSPASPQTGGDWQTAGQGMGQSAGQGRWHARENFAPAHKIAADIAVLHHADAGESVADGARRESGGPRYA